MSASTTLRPREDSPARWRALLNRDAIAIVVAAALAMIATTWLVRDPGRVELTIVNDTDYELAVEAAPATDGRSPNGWTPVLVIDPGQTRERRVTIDQGDTWVFRFQGQGRDAGEITLSRAALRDGDWTLSIPTSVAEQLESQGATPPPRSR